MIAWNWRVFGSLALGTLLGLLSLLGPGQGESGASDRASNQHIRHLVDTADHVRVAAINRPDADSAAIVVVIDPGYHINANPASMDSLIPITLNLDNPTPVRVIYPKPVRFKPKFSDDVLDVYEGTIDIVAEFAPGELGPQGRLLGTLTAQACTDQICLAPANLELPGQ